MESLFRKVGVIFVHFARNEISFYCFVDLLSRFNDISPIIRTKCVQHTMHFLLNHPNLREDIIEVLKSRQHDVDETVRYEVVLAVVTTAKHDFEIVSQSADLLDCVKERTLDKKVIVILTNFSFDQHFSF